MYPLCTWQYSVLEERLKKLLNNELEYEAVIASSQVLEQVIRRTIRSKLSKKGLKINFDKKKLYLTKANSSKELNESMDDSLLGFDRLKEVWRVLFKESQWSSLPNLVNQCCGKETWKYIKNKEKLTYYKGFGIPYDGEYLFYGLRETRHKIIHGRNAPNKETVVFMAQFGVQTCLKLLDPKTGMSSEPYCFRDPFKHSVPFKKT